MARFMCISFIGISIDTKGVDMMRTTPPRPVDIAAVFPELVPLARTTTRLHPRPGKPTPQDSSIGGPLLWPIDDPWPCCNGPHDPAFAPLTTLADVRLLRDMLIADRKQPGLLTAEERLLVKELGRGRHGWTNEPIAMLPIAQLYARDIPDLHPPEGYDLLQVLWCPFDHSETNMPRERVVWRASSTITSLLVEPPQPVAVQRDDYIPEICIIHPEQVIEYPSELELDESLQVRIEEWSENEKAGVDIQNPYYQAEEAYYRFELSVAPGWKVGGWAPWGFRDPSPIICTCGTRMEPLLTISSCEWNSGSGSWIPIEDQASAANPANIYPYPWDPVMVNIGRGHHMQIYRCPISVEHPHFALMQ